MLPPPKHVLSCGLFSLCFPLLCLAAFLWMLPPCACSRNLPPLSSLFCGFSLNVAPLLCLVAFLLLLPPCLSCRCFMLPLSLSCGFSLNVAPLFCLVAVLLMLPPSFLVPVLVMCPPLSCGFSLNVVVFGYLVMLWSPWQSCGCFPPYSQLVASPSPWIWPALRDCVVMYFPHCRTSKDAVIFTRQGAREMDEAKSDFQSTLCATKYPEVFRMLTD